MDQEEGVDFFASTEVSEQPLPENFTPSRGEIVLSAKQAQVISDVERKRRLALCYPDIPEEEREARFFEQKAWMAPTIRPDKQVETFREIYSEGLLEPHKCIIAGTNGNFSFAILCKDKEDGKEFVLPLRAAKREEPAPASPASPAAPAFNAAEAKKALRKKIQLKKVARTNIGGGEAANATAKKEDEDDPTKEPLGDFMNRLEETFQTYAQTNDCFALKLIQHRLLEQPAFYRLHMHVIKNIHSKVELLNLELRLSDMTGIDYGLRDPISRLGKKIKERKEIVPNEPKKGKKPKPFFVEERPGNCYASVAAMAATLGNEVKEEVASGRFSLLVCRTPLGDARPTWKEVGIQIDAHERTVPHVSFNDTHLSVFYQTRTSQVFCVEFFELPPAAEKGKIELTRLRRVNFELPRELGRDGLVSTHLGPEGVFAVAIGCGVMMFNMKEGEGMELPVSRESPVPASPEGETTEEEKPLEEVAPVRPAERAAAICFMLTPSYNHDPPCRLAEPATRSVIGKVKVAPEGAKWIKRHMILAIEGVGTIFVSHVTEENVVHFQSNAGIPAGAKAPAGTKVTEVGNLQNTTTLVEEFEQPPYGLTNTLVLANTSVIKEGKEIFVPSPSGGGHYNKVLELHGCIATLEKPVLLPAGAPIYEDERRQVTSVTVQDGFVLLGTKQGEVYGIRRSTGIVEHCNYMPAVEPIFAAKMNCERIIMQTVMSASYNIDARGENVTVIAADRPIGMDMCGTLFGYVNKYGLIKLYDLTTAKVCKDFSPPIQGARTPLLQHAYPAMKMFRKRIVIVYPSGVVRSIEQTLDSQENVKRTKKMHKRNKV